MLIVHKNLAKSAASFQQLSNKSLCSKISWKTNNPYNQRWQFKWKPSHYTYIRDGEEPTRVKTPEQSRDAVPLFYAWGADVLYRWLPGFQCWYDRRNRLSDNFNVYFLPLTSLFFYQFSHLALGFKVLTYLPWALLYTRIRDRALDPDFKETYLRDMIYQNAEVSKLFNESTIHVLDYEFEYDSGFPDPEKFPEFNNRVFRFFNKDTSMCTGFFKFGDVESGATMTLKMKTMPVAGKFRYQVGEPFFFYDLRAEIMHNGVFK